MADVRFLRTAAFLFGFISFLDFHDENSNERETRHQSVGLMATSLNYTKGKSIHKNTETFRLVFWYLKKYLKEIKAKKPKNPKNKNPKKLRNFLCDWIARATLTTTGCVSISGDPHFQHYFIRDLRCIAKMVKMTEIQFWLKWLDISIETSRTDFCQLKQLSTLRYWHANLSRSRSKGHRCWLKSHPELPYHIRMENTDVRVANP
jgi:hypothetical protein